ECVMFPLSPGAAGDNTAVSRGVSGPATTKSRTPGSGAGQKSKPCGFGTDRGQSLESRTASARGRTGNGKPRSV
ncbi:hypothetical protein VF14_36135, partial [Nostoc linckia z18]